MTQIVVRTMEVRITVEDIKPRRLTLSIETDNFLYADYDWALRELGKWLASDRKKKVENPELIAAHIDENNTQTIEPTGMKIDDINNAKRKVELEDECKRLGIVTNTLKDMKRELCRRAFS